MQKTLIHPLHGDKRKHIKIVIMHSWPLEWQPSDHQRAIDVTNSTFS